MTLFVTLNLLAVLTKVYDEIKTKRNDLKPMSLDHYFVGLRSLIYGCIAII